MDDLNPDDVLTAAQFALVDGPVTLSDLTTILLERGVFEALDGFDFEDLMIELDEILITTDDTFMSDDNLVALTSALLDGAVFTHQIDESELRRSVIDVTPDVGVIDYDVRPGLELPTGDFLKCRYPFDGEEHLDDNGSYEVPIGALSKFQAGDYVGLRRSGRRVTIERIEGFESGDEEKQALRAAFERQYVPETGVEPERLVLDALCHFRTLFRSPVPPMADLLDAIGLEQRGGWLGPSDEDWEPPGVKRMRAEDEALREYWGFDACCDESYQVVRAAWRDVVLRNQMPDRDVLKAVARSLAHSSVAPAFGDYALGQAAEGNPKLASFATELAQLPGKFAAPALFLQALEEERNGETATAESHLRRAVAADPDYGPALAELAWYEADRGDAEKAISLLRRAHIREDNPELTYLESLVSRTSVQAGRNDPCPCGSGKKFKACCINGPIRTIEERAGWLHHKLVTFALRPQRRLLVEGLFEMTTDELSDASSRHLLPFLVDLATFEDGFIEEFLSERGELLPPDEVTLAQTWLGSTLMLWEVVEVDPGATITLRNTRTGDLVIVTERSASRVVQPDEFLLARVVIAGTQHQIVGLPLEINLRQRPSLLELIDSEPDSVDWALWLAAAFGPPRMANREGEDIVLCEAVFQLSETTTWQQVEVLLTKQFGEPQDGQWTETVKIDGDHVVRCFLRRHNDALIIETNSHERFDRILETLDHLTRGGLVLADESRRLPGEELVQPDLWEDESAAGQLPEMRPELLEVLASILREKETAWLDESIPALGGLTPRQAVDDPTRREDLIALLREFDQAFSASSQFTTFDPARIRKQLGL